MLLVFGLRTDFDAKIQQKISSSEDSCSDCSHQLGDFFVFGVGDLFLDDGVGGGGGGGLLGDGASDFLIVGILAIAAGVDLALAGFGVFFLLIGCAFLLLALGGLPAVAEDVVDLASQALHVEPSTQQGDSYHE